MPGRAVVNRRMRLTDHPLRQILRIVAYVIFVLLVGLTARAAELPSYLKEALTHFNPTIPSGWAYTITTRRDKETSAERFDPSLPGDQQWTLLQRNNQSATPEEISRYRSYRITTSTSTYAAFHRGDIDQASIQMVSENDHQAEFRARFRDDLNDQMLRMLELQLIVTKQPATVIKYVFQLTDPYSPVLTVKMLELRVETILSSPTADLPALPLRSVSRFRGRVFLFKHVEEDVETVYSDFVRVKPRGPQAATRP